MLEKMDSFCQTSISFQRLKNAFISVFSLFLYTHIRVCRQYVIIIHYRCAIQSLPTEARNL